MDLNAYLTPIRKWWWLLLVATLVAAGSSYLATRQQLPLYQSTTTLLTGRTIEDPNPSTGEIALGQQLATTYADIAKREQVRRATMEALSLEWLPQYNAQALPQSQILEITVVDTNPIRAQAVASELANQLILQSPTSSSPEEQERLAFINEQLGNIQTQIESTEDEIASLQAVLGELNSAQQIQQTETQIAGLQSKLTTLQFNYANLVSNTQQGASNTLTILEPANLPNRPMNQNSALTISLASAIGLTLGAAAAFLLEFLDKSIRTPEEAVKIFDKPVLGYIPDIPEGNGAAPFVAVNPRSAIAEAFRTLRINVEFAAAGHPLKTIFITSADPAAGKTSLAVNLAVMMAQGGHKVVLMDADLRRPNVHGYLGLSNSEGLSKVFKGDISIKEAMRDWEDSNLKVIPAGSSPPNPAELLGSPIMNEIIETVGEEADFIVIDGPPLVVADASVLASVVDGVLVLIQPGKTHRDSAASIREQMEIAGARIIGLVFNRIPRRSLSYYGRYWYYAPQYSSSYLVANDAAAQGRAVRKKERKTIPAMLMRARPSRVQEPAESSAGESQPYDRGAVSSSVPSAAVGGNGNALGMPKPPKALAVLRWKDTVGKRQKLVLREGDTILIGRDRINDVIIHSRHISRRHAVITWRKELFEIADLGSTNGTYVNGDPAERPIELRDGDKIRLFDVEIVYKKFKSLA